MLGTQIRGVLRLAQFSRPSLCMPVDLLVFLISFLSQAGMCQRCAKVLIHSLIHLFTQTEYPTRQVIQVSYAIGLDSACKLGSPKFITSLKESTQSSAMADMMTGSQIIQGASEVARANPGAPWKLSFDATQNGSGEWVGTCAETRTNINKTQAAHSSKKEATHAAAWEWFRYYAQPWQRQLIQDAQRHREQREQRRREQHAEERCRKSLKRKHAGA